MVKYASSGSWSLVWPEKPALKCTRARERGEPVKRRAGERARQLLAVAVEHVVVLLGLRQGPPGVDEGAVRLKPGEGRREPGGVEVAEQQHVGARVGLLDRAGEAAQHLRAAAWAAYARGPATAAAMIADRRGGRFLACGSVMAPNLNEPPAHPVNGKENRVSGW
jgi:hypothetical protein